MELDRGTQTYVLKCSDEELAASIQSKLKSYRAAVHTPAEFKARELESILEWKLEKPSLDEMMDEIDWLG